MREREAALVGEGVGAAGNAVLGQAPAFAASSEATRSQGWDRRRWIVLAASCLVNLCIGSLYAWSVFASPMAAHLTAINGFDGGSLAIVFSVANAVGPITMISGGAVNDRLGPRWVILAGGLLFGGGMIGAGFSTNLAMLVGFYGLGCGLGMGLVYGAVVSNAVKFFPDKKGLVGGIVTAFYGISSVLVPLIANALIAALDVTAAFKVLGVAMLAVIALCSLAIARCPEGYAPAGWEPSGSQPSGEVGGKDWRGMLTDPVFYLMMAMLCCGAFSGLMVTSQASALAQALAGLDAAAAAVAVSLLALANTVGRIVAGFASDRWGAAVTLRRVFLLLVAGMGALDLSNSSAAALFFCGLLATGLCFGSVMGIYPGFTVQQFGARHNSVNYGIMFIGFALAGVVGPLMMNGLYGLFSSYVPAFLVAALLAATGAALTRVCASVTGRGAISSK